MIKDLENGKNASGIYIVKDAGHYMATNGKAYLSLTLQDASGTIEAKKWNIFTNDEDILKQGNIVEIEGNVNAFKEKLQVIISTCKIKKPEEVDLNKLIPTSPVPVEVLTKELDTLINSISNDDCKKIVSTLITENYKKFIDHPAATKNHHEFLHGLLYHTVSMAKLADAICTLYPQMNRNILVSGCLLHDIGKLVELSGVIGCHYTLEGNLLGHLTIGMNMVDETAKKLHIEGEVPILLKHMILSHHGKLEYGACVLPSTQEAVALSMIDDMDSKFMILDKYLSVTKKGENTERIFAFDNRTFYKPKI